VPEPVSMLPLTTLLNEDTLSCASPSSCGSISNPQTRQARLAREAWQSSVDSGIAAPVTRRAQPKGIARA